MKFDMATGNLADEFKPKMSHDEFLTQLREAGFTEKTLAVLDEEDINTDAALKILSVRRLIWGIWDVWWLMSLLIVAQFIV